MKKFFQFNKVLLFFFIFSTLFVYSNQAGAFFDVIPSLADMQLGALDVVDRIMAWIFNILLLALAGAFFITFSAAFLDWASNLPVDLSLSNNLVGAGWGFTSGLVNMIFILVLVFIAFSYVLKLETWGMKKALPRLIIVAFLLNFSLLFVKMFVDIGWIVQNSLKVSLFGESGMAVPIGSQVAGSAVTAVREYVAWFFAPYFVTALIPFANVARAVWLATAILGEGLFGTFSQTFLLAAFGLIGGLIFFVYAILFLVRMAVIWLLAVVAPLAFAAYILPQTQKYFGQWLKALFQWVFLGVVVFFLMGLGLKLFSVVAPAPEKAFNVRTFDFVAEYTKFAFLLIYLFVSLMAAKKFTPAGANAVWALGGMATGAIGASTTWLARKGAITGATWRSELDSKRAEAKMLPLQAKEKDRTITPRERAHLGKWTARYEVAKARTKMLKGLQVQEQKKKLLEKTKNMDEETAKLWLSGEALKYSAATLRDKDKSQAFVELLADKNALKEGHKTLYQEAVKNAGSDDLANRVKKAVLPRMLHWAKDAKEMDDFIDKMSTADIEKLDKVARANGDVIKAIVRSNKSNLISRLGSQSAEVLKGVQEEVENTLGKKWRTEPQNLTLDELKVLRSLHNSPSFTELGFRTYGELSDIQEGIAKFGKPPAATKEPSKIVTPGSKEYEEEQGKIRKKTS